MKKNIALVAIIILASILSTILYLNYGLQQQLKAKSLELSKTLAAKVQLEKKIDSIKDIQMEGNSETYFDSNNQPLFNMKIIVTGGMEAEYVIDEINEDYVICRYFDYQHYDEPENEQEKITFEQIFNDKSLDRKSVV